MHMVDVRIVCSHSLCVWEENGLTQCARNCLWEAGVKEAFTQRWPTRGVSARYWQRLNRTHIAQIPLL